MYYVYKVAYSHDSSPNPKRALLYVISSPLCQKPYNAQRTYCAFLFCFVFTRRQRRYIYSSFLPFLLILEIALLICSLWGTTFPPLSPCYLREANPISGVQDSRAQYLTGTGDWCRERLCPNCTSEIQAQDLWCNRRKERCFFSSGSVELAEQEPKAASSQSLCLQKRRA